MISHAMEKQAMRYINLIGNWFFGRMFSWIIGQRLRDTLCGTKVLLKEDYIVLSQYREYFHNLDPFGKTEHRYENFHVSSSNRIGYPKIRCFSAYFSFSSFLNASDRIDVSSTSPSIALYPLLRILSASSLLIWKSKS
mgnify:CR=1 FL=1